MKRNIFYILLGVGILFIAGSQLAVAKPKSYLMVCQGGGNMKLRFNNDISGLGTTAIIKIDYTKSSKSGTVEALGAGQCAWMDRPISVKEPDVLVYKSIRTPLKKLDITQGRVVITELKHNAQNRPAKILIESVLNASKFFIHVKRKKDIFEITKVGP